MRGLPSIMSWFLKQIVAVLRGPSFEDVLCSVWEFPRGPMLGIHACQNDHPTISKCYILPV